MKSLILILFLCLGTLAYGQNTDSLIALLAKPVEGAQRVKVLQELGRVYLNGPYQRAGPYLEEALKLSYTNNLTELTPEVLYYYAVYLSFEGQQERALDSLKKGLTFSLENKDARNTANLLNQMGKVYQRQGKYKEAVLVFEESTSFARQAGFTKREANNNYNLGINYDFLGDYKTSVSYFLKALDTFKSIEDQAGIGLCQNSLGVMNFKMKKYDQALAHYLEAVGIYQKENDKRGESNALSNVGSVYVAMGDLEKGESFLLEALEIYQEENNKFGIARIMGDLSHVYLKKENYSNAIEYDKTAVTLFQELGEKYQEAFARKNLASTYERKGDYENARKEAAIALEMTQEIGEVNTRSVILKLLGSIDYETGRYKSAYENLRASRLLNDSLLSERNTRIITELETKYETAEKEKEIAEKQVTINQQEAKLKFRNAIIFAIALLLGLAFLGIMYFRQKQLLARKEVELEQQRRAELEKTQQLHAMNAMIDGQEAERQRIAQELHDGLGGLISTVQLHFDSVESELEELRRLDAYITAQNLLKDTGTELRRIAHDMMPGALIKLGLVEAVSDLCKKMDRTGQLSVFFQSLGMENARLDPTLETSLYRIIQELTNNILKHAAASEVIVQITRRKDHLTVVVEDDGKGFDPESAIQKDGMGLQGIFSRAEHIHAEVDLDSVPGRGTTFTIEVPLS